jgi:G3E family GTPase
MPRVNRPLRLPVPALVVFGARGAGKTTLLRALIDGAGAGAACAAISDEVGAADFDGLPPGAARQLAACACCAAGGFFAAALVQLIRSARPERLLIELGGAADAATALAALGEGHLATAVDVRIVACAVDLARFAEGDAGAREPFARDGEAAAKHLAQAGAASVLVGTWRGPEPAGAAAAFAAWAAALPGPPRRALTGAVTLEGLGFNARPP